MESTVLNTIKIARLIINFMMFSLYSSFRCNRDSKEVFVLSRPALIFNTVHYAVFVLTGVRAFLSWSLVRTNTNLFIFLGAGVPQVKLICDITVDGCAFGIKQSNAVCAGRVEPIIGLAEHLRQRRSEEHTSELQSRLHLVC